LEVSGVSVGDGSFNLKKEAREKREDHHRYDKGDANRGQNKEASRFITKDILGR